MDTEQSDNTVSEVLTYHQKYYRDRKADPEFIQRKKDIIVAYRLRNKEAIVARNKEHYQLHKEAICKVALAAYYKKVGRTESLRIKNDGLTNRERYYQKNKEAVNVRQKAYYQLHKDERNERQKAYYQLHKGEIANKYVESKQSKESNE